MPYMQATNILIEVIEISLRHPAGVKLTFNP